MWREYVLGAQVGVGHEFSTPVIDQARVVIEVVAGEAESRAFGEDQRRRGDHREAEYQPGAASGLQAFERPALQRPRDALTPAAANGARRRRQELRNQPQASTVAWPDRPGS